MQARDVMTREVVTVGPDTSAKYAAEVLADRGFAALPVVDDGDRLLGIVAEADVLRDRLPPDPRLHLRREEDSDVPPPPALVRGVMTEHVRTVDPTADVADVARLFVDARLRSVPVVDRGRLVGIVSRRDLLRTLIRSDDELRADLLRLVEGYTGDLDCWDVSVSEGIATVRRTGGTPGGSAETEAGALRALARTVSGIIGVRVVPAAGSEGSVA
ncbi:CBS domain-containing protein [Geodermatophilus sabuli]|uniref:CBS domain-containing protein n=1 Tax=Geodermatophilus sabuli TaxID=1564158 RepID=A0A285EM35_9ACTN|nr:CBS domain-containing protein [Geodermatophilus sabuli]MBB3083621.1 CBS domain-containing protein [Geodermatophilus sabuli]SNX99051.1 CBS domain-containing protein [Geodermatophilus sabuli]